MGNPETGNTIRQIVAIDANMPNPNVDSVAVVGVTNVASCQGTSKISHSCYTKH